MTAEDGPGLTPDQDDAVRRLLAQTAAADPPGVTPDHVADRLDGVLAELNAERALGAGPTTGVVSLDRARRRRWPQVLVAAAAVSVIGLTVGQQMFRGQLSGGAVTTADAQAGGTAESAREGYGATPEVAPEVAPGDDPASVPGYTRLGTLPRMSSETFAVDAARLELLARPNAVEKQANRDTPSPHCPAARMLSGESSLLVRLDGMAAVLVFGTPSDGSQRVTAYDCVLTHSALDSKSSEGTQGSGGTVDGSRDPATAGPSAQPRPLAHAVLPVP